MTPSHIGQYRIVRKIGAGGMGLVFLGEHTLLGRRAAIKTLLPMVAANHEIVERFFNEARATSAISDPGVIQVFDFGYHVDGTAYIVMELLEGEALSARIDRLGKLAVSDALRIARQIAGSLAAAHAHDIVHRDLKPENIFLVSDAEAQGGERTKILDFGICKVGSDTDTTVTQSGAMVGTPVYMSPEQCRGTGGVDHRSDIYAFGCLMFHMLTGRPPFLGEATGELIVAHLQEEPPAPSVYAPGLSPEVDALVLRCLAKAPEDRYQSMTELQHVLGELYAVHDASEEVIALVKPAMSLGRGFRSMYDANMASRAAVVTRAGVVNRAGIAAGSRASRARPPWMRVAPTTPTTPPPPDDLDDLDLVVPPRHSYLRPVLACVLVAGVALGLVATSYVIYSADRREEAEEAAAQRKAAAMASTQNTSSGATAPDRIAAVTLPVPAGLVRAASPERVAQASPAVRPMPQRPAASPATQVNTAPSDRTAPPPAAPATTPAGASPESQTASAAETERSADDGPAEADGAAATEAGESEATATTGAIKGEASAATLERASRRSPSTSSGDRARSSREKPRDTKKPSAAPRPRPIEPAPPAVSDHQAPPPAPAAPTARPASPAAEDLYDTR